MITPYGKFQWTRLPFGLKVSSEMFQYALNDALGDLDGVICVADDILVVGCGESDSAAREDHDRKVEALQHRCEMRNIKLNTQKTELLKTEVGFLGHIVSREGVKAHPAKIEAITAMPAPVDSPGVRRFCGMVQYMARFVPNLAHDLNPLRALTQKNVPFVWSSECEEAFRTVKKKLTDAPILTYFDPDKELVLQVDSSKDGLGAVLMQQGRPIEYASRTLTSTEQNWAQIEKEALSVVYGLERFDQYTYGREVTVENDHKPLSAILRKPLSQAPKRLQALMLRLHRYDVTFKWVAGSELVIADTLSRACIKHKDTDITRVMNISSLDEVPDKILEAVKQETTQDRIMRVLYETINNGWPEQKEMVPSEVKPFFDFRDTLSTEDGIILKGERILIPPNLRSDIKKQLHAAHLGHASMLRRAKQTVYWPGLYDDLKQVAEACEACQRAKPNNMKEPLYHIGDGDYPFERVGINIFQIEGKSYLVLVDYFSGFIEVDYLTSTSSQQVIMKLKCHFTRYGVPKQIIADNGPQFIAHEVTQFAEKWGINMSFSSPHHHEANGRAEAAVKTIKNMMLKCVQNNEDMYMALLELRNIPKKGTNQSPAQLMFGRETRTMIPSVKKDEVK